MVAANQLMPVRVGDIGIEVEAVLVTGTEATSGRAARAAGDVLEAFGRAQDAIIEVANSTAEMIETAGSTAARRMRPAGLFTRPALLVELQQRPTRSMVAEPGEPVAHLRILR